MKKYFIIAFGILLASQGLEAITIQEMKTELETQADKYRESLDSTITMPKQVRDQRLNNWKNTFNKAKTFVTRMKDANLDKIANSLDATNTNVINIAEKTLSLTSGIQLNKLKQILEDVRNNLDQVLANLSQLQFTLSTKTQAKDLLAFMGKTLKDITAPVGQNITIQAKSIAPALPPRKTQQEPTTTQPSPSNPSTPPNRPLPATPTKSAPRPLPATPTSSNASFVMTPQMINVLEKELNNPSAAHLDYIRRLLVAHEGVAIGSSPIIIQNEERLQQEFEAILNKFKNTFLNELRKFNNQNIGVTIGMMLSDMIFNALKSDNIFDLKKDSQTSILIDANLARATNKVFPNGKI